MEVVILPDEAAIGALVADAVCSLLTDKPDAVLGLATGSSPLATYRELIHRHQTGTVTFAQVRGFLLDEYVALPANHPQRYRSVIRDELESHVDFADGAVTGPDGTADDLPGACAAYEEAIADAGGIDLQLLGIGTDGHLAFNEPGSSLSSRTRVKTLTRQTREDNARFFGSIDAVPKHVLTQGLATIREARHCVLMATGDAKAAAVAAMVEGPVSAMCPASVLQLHPHATVVIDDAAAKDLRLAYYFRQTWSGKPDWQSI